METKVLNLYLSRCRLYAQNINMGSLEEKNECQMVYLPS